MSDCTCDYDARHNERDHDMACPVHNKNPLKIKVTTDYKFLIPKFIEAMNDIGVYGEEKYKENSFFARAAKDDKSRGNMERTETRMILYHATQHLVAYEMNVPHDHFNDKLHQLAASAFNAMMEAYFAGLCEVSNGSGTETSNQDSISERLVPRQLSSRELDDKNDKGIEDVSYRATR